MQCLNQNEQSCHRLYKTNIYNSKKRRFWYCLVFSSQNRIKLFYYVVCALAHIYSVYCIRFCNLYAQRRRLQSTLVLHRMSYNSPGSRNCQSIIDARRYLSVALSFI